MSVDLPAFGAPIKATKPQCVEGRDGRLREAHAAPVFFIRAYAFARDENLGRGLFGAALRKALRLGGFMARDDHRDREFRRVVGAGPRKFAGRWEGQARALAPIPAKRFWDRARAGAASASWPQTRRVDHVLGRLETTVEKNRADDRLANIAEDRGSWQRRSASRFRRDAHNWRRPIRARLRRSFPYARDRRGGAKARPPRRREKPRKAYRRRRGRARGRPEIRAFDRSPAAPR